MGRPMWDVRTRMKTTIIAEAGVNHDGSLDKAKRLADLAKAAGADYVKFQTFSADQLVTKSAKTADYQASQIGAKSQYEMLKKLELARTSIATLFEYCKNIEIGVFSTGFDVEDVAFLADLGQSIYKVPSGEITNLPYLEFIGKLGGPVILSTGMADLGEVEAALAVLYGVGLGQDQVTLLHCTTEYPAPMADVNLKALGTLRTAFNVDVGYSDHTS